MTLDTRRATIFTSKPVCLGDICTQGQSLSSQFENGLPDLHRQPLLRQLYVCNGGLTGFLAFPTVEVWFVGPSSSAALLQMPPFHDSRFS